jgi:UDP-N-acetylglucosamine/UDP-N-acetylgalactosamine diphosphorylase
LSNDGKFFLSSPSELAVAPDGNGGIYTALRAPLDNSTSSTILSDLKERGIKFLHAYGVDNCLVRPADPAFLGYCISRGAHCGTKVVTKTRPDESVGVVALRSGKWGVVEYSEIPKSVAEERDPSDPSALKFRAANIANHFYTTEFLDSVASFAPEMAYHVARKKIPAIDPASESAEVVKPLKPNGIKLELFIFDVLPFLAVDKHVVLEVERREEFSPLKNAPGTGADDPVTSRRDLLDQQKRWLEQAGAEVVGEVEVSPKISYAGEGLELWKGMKAQGIIEP